MPEIVRVLMSADEIAKARAAEIASNEDTYRTSVAAGNRDAGLPEPKQGAKLYVATTRGLKVRNRAGLAFSEVATEVTVVAGDDAKALEKQKQGAYVVNAWGAEQILADSNGPGKGLVMWSTKPGDQALVDASDEALAAELARRSSRAAPAGMKGEERIASTRGDKK
jgi:hypothetical protein